jgi:hypothetical protein
LESGGEGFGKMYRRDGVLAQTQFLQGESVLVGWVVGWLECTDDDFGEAFEAEGSDRRDSAVLKIDLLQLVSAEW